MFAKAGFKDAKIVPVVKSKKSLAGILILIPFLTGCIAPRPSGHGQAAADRATKTIKAAAEDDKPQVLFANPGPRKLVTDKDGNEMWQGRAEVGRFGGALRLAEFGAGPKTFNTWDASDATSHGIGLIQFESLVDYDAWTGKPIPRLAKSFEVSKDGLSVTFVLRKGLKWSDGVPLNADDVVFTFAKIVKEGYGELSARDTLSVENNYPRSEQNR